MRLGVLSIVLVSALAAAAVASARTIQDPADTPGKLDLRSASFVQDGKLLRFSITTWRPWSAADLYSRQVTRNVCVLIWTRSATSRMYDFSACGEVIARHRTLEGGVFENGGEEQPVSVGRARLGRPDAATLTFSFPARLVDSPKAFRWRVRSFYSRFDFTAFARERLR
jgi:hypothetical protein